jgi:hypothetical protein
MTNIRRNLISLIDIFDNFNALHLIISNIQVFFFK